MKITYNKYFLYLVVCLLMVALFTGCGSSDSEEFASGDSEVRTIPNYYKSTVTETGKLYLATTDGSNVTVEAKEGTFENGTQIFLAERELYANEAVDFPVSASRVFTITGIINENGTTREIQEVIKPITITIPNPFPAGVSDFYLGFKPADAANWQYKYLGNSYETTFSSSRLSTSNSFIINTYRLNYSYTIFVKKIIADPYEEEKKKEEEKRREEAKKEEEKQKELDRKYSETVSDFIFSIKPDTYVATKNERKEAVYPEDITVSVQVKSDNSTSIFGNLNVEAQIIFFNDSPLESNLKIDGMKASEIVSSKPVSTDNKYMHTIRVNSFRSENVENMGSVATYSFVLNLKEEQTSVFPKEFRVIGAVKTSVGLVFSSEDLMILTEHQPEITTVCATLAEPEVTESVATSSVFVIDFDSALLWNDSDKSKFSITAEDKSIIPFETEISENKKQVMLTPASPLKYGTVFYVSVLDGLTASDDNKVIASACFMIKTADSEDGVSTIIPADGCVFNDKYILKPEFIISFSKPVMSYEMLKDSLVVKTQNSYVDYKLVLNESRNKAVLSFNDYLTAGETYSVSLSKIITDSENIAIKPFEKLSFETSQLLNVISSVPAKDAVDIATSTVVSVTFEECISCSGELNSIFILKDSENNIASATVKISDDRKSIVLTPVKPLLHNMTYTVSLGDGIISEDSKQPLMMADFSFTTGDSDVKYQAVLNIADSGICFDYKNNKKYYTDTEFEIDFNTAVSNREAVTNQIKFFSNQQEFSPSSIEWTDNKVHFTFPVEKHFGSNYVVAIDGKIKDDRNVEILPFKAIPMSLMDFDGRGSEESPFIVVNPCQLDMVRFYLNKHFKQGADVDLSGYVSEFYENYETEGFLSIGNAMEPFIGSYNGDNKVISGLFMNKPWMGQIGLFGYISNAKISNVKIVGTTGCQITCAGPAGAIVGYAENSIIDSCSNSLTVTGSSMKGGIAGLVDTTIVKNCTNDAEITGDSKIAGIVGYATNNCIVEACINSGNVSATSDFAGGITGHCSFSSTIKTCINNGNISSGNFVSGIAGMGETDICIDDSDNYGQITGSSGTGGIVGQSVNFVLVQQCNNEGNITGTTEVGGIIGNVTGNMGVKVTDCKNTAVITGESSVGGISGFVSGNGYTEYLFFMNCENTGAVNGTTDVGGIGGCFTLYVKVSDNSNSGDVTGSDNVGGIAGRAYNNVEMKNNENHGKITASNDYAGGIYGLGPSMGRVAVSGCKNDNDVTANNYCGGIAGNVGAGSIVSKCVNKGNVSVINDYCGGCFGKITEASTITECSSTGDVSGVDNIGGFVGYVGESSVVGSSTVAFESITGNDFVGGFGGNIMNGAVIEYCTVEGINISGNDFVGGFGGSMSSSASVGSSTVEGISITGNDHIGGFTGQFMFGSSALNDSVAFESIAGNDYVGGFCGDAINSGRIWDSNAAGESVTGNQYVAGFSGKIGPGIVLKRCYAEIGIVKADADYAGGLTGFCDVSVNSDNCYAVCNEISATNYAGGLAGYIEYSSPFVNCYAICDEIAATSYAGGLAGCIYGVSVVQCCYTVCCVAGNSNVGALVGYNNGIVADCFTTVNSKLGGVNVSDVSQIYGMGSSGSSNGNHLLTNGFASEIRETAWSYMDWFNETIWKLNDDCLPTLVNIN